MGKILVTGFGPFGAVTENLSEAALHGLSGLENVHTHVFPTSNKAVEAELPALLESIQPLVVVMFGYAPSSAAIRLERWARNETNGGLEDVDGNRHSGSVLDGGPLRLRSSLPLTKLRQAFVYEQFSVEFSDDAGSYVCNFAFYLLQCYAGTAGIKRSGLIHLPSPERYEERSGHAFDYGAAVRFAVTSVGSHV